MIFPKGFFHGFDEEALAPYLDFLRSRRAKEKVAETRLINYNNLQEMIEYLEQNPEKKIAKIYQERRYSLYDNLGNSVYFYNLAIIKE